MVARLPAHVIARIGLFVCQLSSGSVGLDLLEKGELDLSFLGSAPAVIGISAPRNLPIEIISIEFEIGAFEAMVVRPEIQTRDVRLAFCFCLAFGILGMCRTCETRLLEFRPPRLYTTSSCIC